MNDEERKRAQEPIDEPITEESLERPIKAVFPAKSPPPADKETNRLPVNVPANSIPQYVPSPTGVEAGPEGAKPLCPKGHPVPYKDCKYCALGDIANDSREKLIALLFKWHDAFYREEARANDLHYRLIQCQYMQAPAPQHAAGEGAQRIESQVAGRAEGGRDNTATSDEVPPAKLSEGVGTPPNRSSNQAGAESSGSGVRHPSLSNEHPQSTSPTSEPRCRVEGCGKPKGHRDHNVVSIFWHEPYHEYLPERRKGQRRKHKELKRSDERNDTHLARAVKYEQEAATLRELVAGIVLYGKATKPFDYDYEQFSEMKQRAEQAERRIIDYGKEVAVWITGDPEDAADVNDVEVAWKAIKEAHRLGQQRNDERNAAEQSAANLRELLREVDGLLYVAQLELNDWIARHGEDNGITVLRQRIQKALQQK